MTTNKDVSLSNQIYKSRDEIRNQIIEYMRTYLELENVDLTKSTFLSFMVNTLSTITSNLIFYQSSVYREFFLTKAQLSESIYSLSTFIGYTPEKATNSTAEILFTIPLEFQSSDISFTIPRNFLAQGGDITFTTDYDVEITIKDNSFVQVKIIEDNKSYNIPVEIDTENNECSFLLTMKQIKKNEQEFQIDEDVKKFQFINIDVPLELQLSDIYVLIKSPNSSYFEPYEEYSSLFLINPEEKGFVQRSSDDGIRLYFGNGLIGYQPEPGSTVIVETIETHGESGNVIPGSIKNGDRIYVVDDGERQILNYSITNPVAASGGKDQESTEEIRNNAISNLVSMDRLVSEIDYNNFEKITDNNIFDSSVPVLKRSDLKVNEIQLFTIIYKNQEIIPFRNEVLNTTDTFIPKGTIISVNGEDFETIFDMSIDSDNQSCLYYYYIDKIQSTPSLERSNDIGLDSTLIITNYEAERESDNLIIIVHYMTDDGSDNFLDKLSCDIELLESQDRFTTIHSKEESIFEIAIPFSNLPNGLITVLFNIYYEDDLILSYSDRITLKTDLRHMMSSNVVIDTTGSDDIYIVYDTPVVRSDYLSEDDEFDKLVLQNIVQSDLESKRMLTDFLNIKFANSVGYITNMLKNTTKSKNIISLVDDLPDDPDVGDRYIYKPEGSIATYDGDGNWNYNIPPNNTIVYVEDLSYKMLFNGEKWLKPEYKIPLEIEIEAFLEPGVEMETSTIKNELYNQLSDLFGPNLNLYKSQLISIIHNIDGIKFCHITKPESDIFFNFSTDDFTKDELLEYTPELVHFTKDSINVKLLQG